MAKLVKGGVYNSRTPFNIGQGIYDSLFYPLDFFSSIEDLQDRDVAFLSSLVSISALLPNYMGMYRKRERLSTHLYLFISGEPASSKGKMGLANELVRPVSDRLRAIRRSERERYELELAKCKSAEDKLKVKRPFKSRLRCSTNITEAALIKNLENSPNGCLLIASEADFLVKSIKSDYGGKISPILRAAFHHEEIEKELSTDDYEAFIAFPMLACLISGTPNQLKYFVDGESYDNGLCTRFLQYKTFPSSKGIDQEGEPVDKGFGLLRGTVKKMYEDLDSRAEPLIFFRNREQERYVENFFNPMYGKLNKVSRVYRPFLVRHVLSAFRICGILTAVRNRHELLGADSLQVNDDDVEIACKVVKTLFKHTIAIQEEYCNAFYPRKVKNIDVYNSMPNEFRHVDFVRKSCGMRQCSERQSRRGLAKLLDLGMVDRCPDGGYKKV